MWILLGFNIAKRDCELYSRSVNLFPSAKLPSHLKVFQLWGRWRSGNCTHVCVYIYKGLKYLRISKCVAAMTKVKILTNDSWLSFSGRPMSWTAFWKSRPFFSFVCFQLLMHEAFWKGDSFRRVHALDLERGNNSRACSSALSASVWGQIYWADLVFQYIVAAGHRSSTSDFLQNQSSLTFVKLLKMFCMLKCWFFQQHLTSQNSDKNFLLFSKQL